MSPSSESPHYRKWRNERLERAIEYWDLDVSPEELRFICEEVCPWVKGDPELEPPDPSDFDKDEMGIDPEE